MMQFSPFFLQLFPLVIPIMHELVITWQISFPLDIYSFTV